MARRHLRETASLTRGQVAARMGVSRETVRAWESGRSTPRGRKREAYARLLNTLEVEAAVTATQVKTTGAAEEQRTAGASGGSPTAVAAGADSAPAAGEIAGEAGAGTEAGREAGAAGPPAPVPAGDAAVSAEGPHGPEPGSVPGSGPDAENAEPAERPGTLTPAQAFDALYAFCAPALVRQAYLLSGRRELARESVERAFQLAWERWPEVARDPDPAGWVRAAVYEYALSPWHRFRLRHRHAEAPPAGISDRLLMRALLKLPPSHRRTLVLYDGVGLGLAETAAETEATTPASANRLLRARAAVSARLPELEDPQELHRRLAELASTERLRTGRPPSVRAGSERRARFWTRAAIAFTVALVGATALTVRTAPTQYEPPVAPGETVRGVPPRQAPGPLSDEELQLRAKLRDDLQSGTQRLVPQAR
ncbi:helix-turn-helix domain-containing protein [Streptomyces poriticola]|uniref:helix-turn-helix domain-containing protein n=1 Tax=Streptomyces poriticola TaxID=3120506 RepID=UPI0038CD26B8